jgi:hypothetical protein
MSTSQESAVTCGACGFDLADVSAGGPLLTPVGRVPCPRCGSLSRLASVTIKETVEIHDKIRYKAKRPGEKKPHVEGLSGASYFHDTASYFHDTGEWHDRKLWLDRRSDEYHEVIRDSRGVVVHECHEPFTNHQGHGSAKRSPKRATRASRWSPDDALGPASRRGLRGR